MQGWNKPSAWVGWRAIPTISQGESFESLAAVQKRSYVPWSISPWSTCCHPYLHTHFPPLIHTLGDTEHHLTFGGSTSIVSCTTSTLYLFFNGLGKRKRIKVRLQQGRAGFPWRSQTVLTVLGGLGLLYWSAGQVPRSGASKYTWLVAAGDIRLQGLRPSLIWLWLSLIYPASYLYLFKSKF